MDGILLVDKPKGWTSFDVVAKVRSTLRSLQPSVSSPSRKVKVGHTGTLDPMATGLLVLLLGNYTKRAQEFSKLDKTYEVTMCLGQTSTTGDEEGQKTDVSNKKPSKSLVFDAIEQNIGMIKQVPPAYSAVKVGGQRAYKLAREGKEVNLESRPVTIHEITDIKYNYPEITFTAKVSSGTYVRSLAEDIGKELTTGAYLSELRRTQVGDYRLEESLSIDSLSAELNRRPDRS